MKHIFLYLACVTLALASFDNISSFQADFTQSVTDDKKKVLSYSGTVIASKPQNAVWKYIKPINKLVYINSYKVTIIEPEIEQAIVKRIESNFDFFNMIKNAKMITKDVYIAKYKNSEFTIMTENKLIKSIAYIDEFENSVQVVFENQEQNEKIDEKIFIPHIPIEFDIVRD